MYSDGQGQLIITLWGVTHDHCWEFDLPARIGSAKLVSRARRFTYICKEHPYFYLFHLIVDHTYPSRHHALCALRSSD